MRMMSKNDNMDKVHDLVQTLIGLTREQDLDSIIRSREYMQRWFSENVNLEGIDSHDAFFFGYFVGAACIHEFYLQQDSRGKQETDK